MKKGGGVLERKKPVEMDGLPVACEVWRVLLASRKEAAREAWSPRF
jgi:hypothetical protein